MNPLMATGMAEFKPALAINGMNINIQYTLNGRNSIEDLITRYQNPVIVAPIKGIKKNKYFPKTMYDSVTNPGNRMFKSVEFLLFPVINSVNK